MSKGILFGGKEVEMFTVKDNLGYRGNSSMRSK
jgi:hypothetical protein